MAIKSAKRRSFVRGRLSGQLVDALERMMFEEFSQPGDRWPTESELAERFCVSRIVVREAIKILEDRGVIEVRAGSGTFTRTPSLERVKISLQRMLQGKPVPSPQEAELLLELREVLEETVAALAAVRAQPEDLQAMEQALDAMSTPNADIHCTTEADLRFHKAIARASHNRYFEMVLDPLNDVFLQQMALTDSFTIGVEDHRRIYEDIRNGNPVAARQSVRRLMRITRADVRQALDVIQSSVNGSHRKQAAGQKRPRG